MTKYLGSYPDLGSGGARMLHPRAQGEVFLGLQITTPSNPPSGYDALYFKSDGNLYRLTPAGTETKITLSGGIVNADVDAAADIAMTKVQPYEFLAYAGSVASNVTGNGMSHTVQFGTVIKNESSQYNSGTGVFTAPVTGTYSLRTVVAVSDLSSAMTSGQIRIVTSNRTFFKFLNPANARDAGNTASFDLSVDADMDANDTASVTFQVDGGTLAVDISGTTDGRTFFGGHLIG